MSTAQRDHVADLLPWWLNGSLSPEEAARVEEHLASCPACATERDEALEAAGIFAAHLPTEAIVAVAWEREPSLPPALVESHLAGCEDCAAELDLTRQSRRLEANANLASFTPRTARTWKLTAVAAGLIAAVALAGWLATALRQPPGARAQLEVNATVVELFPSELVLRGAAAAPPLVATPIGGSLTLILASQGVGDGPFALELTDDAGEVVWSTAGLRRQPEGDFTLIVPAGSLAPGRYTARILERGASIPLEVFPFELVP